MITQEGFQVSELISVRDFVSDGQFDLCESCRDSGDSAATGSDGCRCEDGD